MKFGFPLLISSVLLSMSLIGVSAWAKDEGGEALNASLCEGMLGYTLKATEPGRPFQFEVSNGIGARGFLGSYPEAGADNVSVAAAQGVMYWGHSLAVRKSVVEAAAHDARFQGLSKILYLISDVDVSDLTDDSEPDLIQSRFARISASADVVYFEEVEGRQETRTVPRDVAQRLIHPQTIEFFSKDDRGPRFHQRGWAFPKTRGVLLYRNIFESGSDTIRKLMNRARGLERKGYTITFNQAFHAALDKARDQVRLIKGEGGTLKAIPDGSRYRDLKQYQAALDGFKMGRNVSVEVRSPLGALVAGVLGQRHGNVWSFDTIFYDFTKRDSESILTPAELAAMSDARDARSLIDLAKIAALAGFLRLHDHGIDVTDAAMVTPFTASLKGVYVSGEEFAGYVQDLSSRPHIEVDLKTPFSFGSRRE